jgi:hypothetical protein
MHSVWGKNLPFKFFNICATTFAKFMCQICVPFAKRRMEFATSHSPKNASNFLSKKIAQNVDKIDV